MAEEKIITHECRAAGLVFETVSDWTEWLKKNNYDIKKPVAEREGFKYDINDRCINPHQTVSELKAKDGAPRYNFVVKTAKTQFGWIWGYDLNAGTCTHSGECAYPSRYDKTAIFYETEGDASYDAVSFIIRQLEAKAKKNKFANILLWQAKKMRADIIHPQTELFTEG